MTMRFLVNSAEMECKAILNLIEMSLKNAREYAKNKEWWVLRVSLESIVNDATRLRAALENPEAMTEWGEVE